MIYNKMNRLTSLCYPQYKGAEATGEVITNPDTKVETPVMVGAIGQKLRMKPPLVKFRLGELYGNMSERSTTSTNGTSAEMVGFINSLSYTYPDNAPWEIQKGYRVPKYIEAEITFKVIHTEVPSLEYVINNLSQNKEHTFYGINKTLAIKNTDLFTLEAPTVDTQGNK